MKICKTSNTWIEGKRTVEKKDLSVEFVFYGVKFGFDFFIHRVNFGGMFELFSDGLYCFFYFDIFGYSIHFFLRNHLFNFFYHYSLS